MPYTAIFATNTSVKKEICKAKFKIDICNLDACVEIPSGLEEAEHDVTAFIVHILNFVGKIFMCLLGKKICGVLILWPWWHGRYNRCRVLIFLV